MHIQWIPLKWLVLMTVWYFNLIICDMPVSLDVSHVSLCSVWFESAASRPTGVIMGRFTCWPLTTWRPRSAFNRPYPSSKHIYRGQQTQMTQTRFLNVCFDSFFCCVRVQFAHVRRAIRDERTLWGTPRPSLKGRLVCSPTCGRLGFVWWE